ncbi:hypothetical protein EW026_g6334 [Hermanssonia centrifuga]|uniref:non-specific serine/threonine protein kinase n=1 Tax=Hermanssonia centrifuga TaxID=98765 RepID=A0A4V3X9S2_9APHY|nr:hypothetical protein EW026_g6334 [Hermanssonia centrifuga]
MAAQHILYDPLDVIGNGSFGIIRKVFARKELNFERMTERDRKQIVAEVCAPSPPFYTDHTNPQKLRNILKDLQHEHIVRYHDRYVDRDAGMLYILMEYCGGGDLSTVIKQAQRHGRPIPEDTIWNYFMQLLLALNHCHHPQNPGRHSSGSSSGEDSKERRPQILHRDLKPDNVFLDENNAVKLGDFGLSKALAQASFANTYVGTPYYMSPELMQEKAYDSKSDIWSLGCLIYELCALRPPFHEAKTHAELSILIRNGRIPPLPKGYSPTLSSVIKAMLNLNPAMRPSATQLLQHERLDLAFKVSETQKMLTAVKTHKAAVLAKERDVTAREAVLLEKENHLTSLLSQKDDEIASLRSLISTAESKHHAAVREALLRREEELRAMVLKQEEDVRMRMTKREEEIMEAVARREEEIGRMWAQWELETRERMATAVDERITWVQERTAELEREQTRLESTRSELERRMEQMEAAAASTAADRRVSVSVGNSGHRMKTPLEEVKNILAPLTRLTDPIDSQQTPVRPAKSKMMPEFQTPMNRAAAPLDYAMPSAMKGVILTETGEKLATPSPAEVAKLFIATPKVSLNFAQIFDFDSESEAEEGVQGLGLDGLESDSADETAAVPSNPQPAPQRTGRVEYDLSDEENLPSPFLKKIERERITRTASVPAPIALQLVAAQQRQPPPETSAPKPRAVPRKSQTLRAMAVVNSANGVGGSGTMSRTVGGLAKASGAGTAPGMSRAISTGGVRPSIAKAKLATEEARKTLFRP